MIVDTHVHPVSDDLARYPQASTDPDWHTGRRFTAEDALHEMDLAGVAQMVLVSSFSAYKYDNSYCADAVMRFPDRFIGVCRIDPAESDAADTLERWVDKGGIHGVRLASAGPEIHPICERSRDLGVTVALWLRWDAIQQVTEIADRFPTMNFVLDHLGYAPMEDGPPYSAAAEFWSMADRPNIYLKLSTGNIRSASRGRSTPRALVDALLANYGANRIMWGSDFPHSSGSAAAPYGDLVNLAQDLLTPLSAAERDWILSGTARAVYPHLQAGA